MTKTDERISFERISASIGSLLLLWSGIEKALTVALLAQHGGQIPRGHHGIKSRIAIWSRPILAAGDGRQLQRQVCQAVVSHLEHSLDLRNLICHGLVGIGARLGPDEPEAHLIVERAKVQRQIYWTELQTMFPWMSRTPWVIKNLTDAAMAPDDASADLRLHGWRRFPLID